MLNQAMFVIFSAALFVGMCGVVLAAVGLAWSPFAGLVSASVARSRGLNARTHGMMGAIYSISGFVPWLLILTRMRGKSLYEPLVGIGYVILFMAWFVGLAQVFMLGAHESDAQLFFLGTAIMGGILWSHALILLLREFRWAGGANEACDTDHPIHVGYVLPFAYAYLWLAMVAGMFALA